ncbi:MAG: YneF family protein [Mollicutes bacterium]|nr:YneF family protein [Mollicutes bacterium]MCI7058335.1 YneF family protein [Mollicutes bacterium]MDD7715363.1 YneF family protein [Mollicutes bacterium]MDY3904408.1 YneF family protein [Candidatus Enteromonas sp.]MDY4936047.1 YneF family protein [Candidatus Enteromonas sp.]
MSWDGGWFGLVIGALIIGLVGGFFGAKALIKKELEKNPPINEKMIRAMFLQMGRKPTEANIRAVMNSMKKNNNL